jgi:hypothetical protein
MLKEYKKQYNINVKGMSPAQQEIAYRKEAARQIMETEEVKYAKIPEGYVEPKTFVGQT